jgi:hypothetical protein
MPYPLASLSSRLIATASGRHFSAGQPPPTTAGQTLNWPAKWLNSRPPPTDQLGRFTAQAHPRPAQMRLQFIEGSFNFPPLLI